MGWLSVGYLVAPLARPWLDPPLALENGQWQGLVCLQSHGSTCGPAAAATLLGLHGIESSETEMIGNCLTSQLGTEALGIFRGLKLGVGDRETQVRVASQNPSDWSSSRQLPNVAMVQFPKDEFGPIGESRAVPRRFLGYRHETGHAIVVISHADGKWKIADPAIGLVEWSDEELLRRYTGEAMYLSRD